MIGWACYRGARCTRSLSLPRWVNVRLPQHEVVVFSQYTQCSPIEYRRCCKCCVSTATYFDAFQKCTSFFLVYVGVVWCRKVSRRILIWSRIRTVNRSEYMLPVVDEGRHAPTILFSSNMVTFSAICPRQLHRSGNFSSRCNLIVLPQLRWLIIFKHTQKGYITMCHKCLNWFTYRCGKANQEFVRVMTFKFVFSCVASACFTEIESNIQNFPWKWHAASSEISLSSNRIIIRATTHKLRSSFSSLPIAGSSSSVLPYACLTTNGISSLTD